MKNREQILTDIFNSKIVEHFAVKVDFCSDTQREEFCAEMYALFCEIDESKLVELWEKDELYFYIIKILRTQTFDKYSDYNKKYNNASEKRAGFEIIYTDSIGIYKEDI